MSHFRVNGIPSCVNDFLLKQVLRKEYNFTGFMVSDAGAIEDIINTHKYFKSREETVAAAVRAGCNLEISVYDAPFNTSVYTSTTSAVEKGFITEKEVRDSIKHLFKARMQLGEFDPPEMVPYRSIGTDQIDSKSHRDLAIKGAMMTMVLMKNEDNVLPIKSKLHTVTVSVSIILFL